MQQAILTLNAGSSSLKFAVFHLNKSNEMQLYRSGLLDGLNANPRFVGKDQNGQKIHEENFAKPEGAELAEVHGIALGKLLSWLESQLGETKLLAVGHRVVHGGNQFLAPAVIDQNRLKELTDLIPLAPLHQPHNVNALRIMLERIPDVLQVACFDTQFHATQSELARSFAIPEDISPLPLKRFGFHGISYEYIASVLPQYLGEKADGKIIVAHMGNGSSMCAMSQRKCVATTMGYSVLDGMVMGTRCGDIDPGVLLYLLQDRGMTAKEVNNLLYYRSGLLGVSGISADMRILSESNDPKAKFAIDLFVYRANLIIGSLVSALGGLDALVFTAGIGENAANIREKICAGCEWAGITLDPQANNNRSSCISTKDSRTSAWIIPTNEELMMARHAFDAYQTLN